MDQEQEENQPEQEKPQQGPLGNIIDAVNNSRDLINQVRQLRKLAKLARLGAGAGAGAGGAAAAGGAGAAGGAAAGTGAAAGATIGLPVIIGIIVVLIVLVLIIALFGGGTTAQPSGQTGNIASCTFYRGGDQTPGLRFGNPQMAHIVSEIAGKVGIPSAVLAGVMRVETASALASADLTYLTNDYDSHSSGVAYGVMQFTPNTFLNTFNANRNAMATLFGKTDVKTDIDPQSAMAPQHILRIYSIKDSLIAAAFKIKADKQSFNGQGPWDQEALNEIARRYYGCLRYGPGGCAAGQFSYGEDLYNSFSKCQPSGGTTPSSPIAPSPPATFLELKEKLKTEFRIDFQSNYFTTPEGMRKLQWAWEILWQARYYAPNFFNLLGTDVIVKTHNATSERVGNAIFFSTNPGSFFLAGTEQQFKVLLIHELGHVIRGDGSKYDVVLSQVVNLDRSESGTANGYLTGYGQNPCFGTASIDEDFSETVTYYINKRTPEQDLGCGKKSTGEINPLESGKYPHHLNFAEKIFGKPFQ